MGHWRSCPERSHVHLRASGLLIYPGQTNGICGTEREILAQGMLIAKADLAFEDACRKIIVRARAANTEIVIWRDGKMVELSPDEAKKQLEATCRDAIQRALTKP